MFTSSITINIHFCSTDAGSKLIGHPASVTVPKGTEANFTCVIKYCGNNCHGIRWRVGTFNLDGYEFQSQRTLKNQDIVKNYHCTCNSSTRTPKETAVITIVATSSMNGTAVQCRSSQSGRSTYSKFALLQLEPATDTVSPGGLSLILMSTVFYHTHSISSAASDSSHSEVELSAANGCGHSEGERSAANGGSHSEGEH